MIKDEKKIAQNLALDDRIERIALKDAFGTLKDHKDGFQDDPKIRLINPTKTNIGKIAKAALERGVESIRKCLGLSLWKNSAEVIS